MSADIFVSYSRQDRDRVLAITRRLEAAGISVWIDQGGIDGATFWGEEIVNAIEGFEDAASYGFREFDWF